MFLSLSPDYIPGFYLIVERMSADHFDLLVNSRNRNLLLPPTPPSPPITDLNGPSMVEKVEGGHKCRKKLPRRRDGRMRPVAGAAEMGQFSGLEAVIILFDSFPL